MNNLYNISLTTLSPIHIGTGDTLTSIGEYIATSASIKIVDQQALNKLFESHTGLRERFLFHIGEKQKNSNIFQFFKDEGLEQDISFTRTIPLHAKDFNTTSNNLLELLIDAGCGNYIPGSSLKGAFRSLFFAAAIMDDPSLKKKVSEIITSSELISKPNKKLTEQDILKQIRKQVEQLEDRLFQDDMTRFKVRDSGPFAGEDLCVEIAKREHLFGVDSTGLDVLRECI